MTFDQAIERLFAHEGGFSNNKSDPGGLTMFGITEAVARANGYGGNMRDLTATAAKEIYRKIYWDAPGITRLPLGVQYDVFDGAVNSGPAQSIKWLQRSVGALDDGVIGPQTIKCCLTTPAGVIVAKYNGQRLKFMCDIKTWPDFGRGWARRIAANLIEA